MLFPIQTYILQNSLVEVTAARLQVAHLLLVAVNITIACCLKRKMAFEYLGQVNMLALCTILATMPVLLLNKYHFIEHRGINNLYLFLLVIFVLKEYKRRMSFAGIIKKYPLVYAINIFGICAFIIYLLGWK